MCVSVNRCRALLWWKIAFSSYSKTGCKFPKWHFCTHFYHFVLEYGSALLTYTGSFEKSHRFLCKLPYLRTGRRVGGVWEQVTVRVALADRVVKVKSTLEAVLKQRAKDRVDRWAASPEERNEADDDVGANVRTPLQQLLEEHYPKKYRGVDDGECAGAQWDNQAYTRHGLV